MPELPYVNFYCSDWLGDTKVRRMSHEQRGVHIDLLCHAWGEDEDDLAECGAIPADPDELAHLLGITRRKLDSLWPKVSVAWKTNASGGFVNPRLEKERAKQRAKRNGRKGGSDG